MSDSDAFARFREAGRQLDRLDDRGAAIVGAAFVEDQLLPAIAERFSNRDQKLEKQLFAGMGPLSSFSAKIKMGYLLGLYDETVLKKLDAIRSIRNSFAHSIEPLTFETDHIRDKCFGVLTPIRDMARELSSVSVGSLGPFNGFVNSLASAMGQGEETARRRYSLNVFMCWVLCHLQTDTQSKREWSAR